MLLLHISPVHWFLKTEKKNFLNIKNIGGSIKKALFNLVIFLFKNKIFRETWPHCLLDIQTNLCKTDQFSSNCLSLNVVKILRIILAKYTHMKHTLKHMNKKRQMKLRLMYSVHSKSSSAWRNQCVKYSFLSGISIENCSNKSETGHALCFAT